MELKDTIRYFRKNCHMTQEELAKCLHVTHAAISKWERGFAFPDIKLLPVMARLFQTDVNTLLSFDDTLNDKEIALLLKPLDAILDLREAFAYVEKQLFAYPGCERLRLACADELMRRLIKCEVNSDYYEEMEKQLLLWYQSLSDSRDAEIAVLGKERMVAHYLRKEEFGKARELLEQLSQQGQEQSKRLRLQYFLALHQYDEAEQLCEEQLYQQGNELISLLMQLIELRRKRKHFDTVDDLIAMIGSLCKLLGIWPYPSLMAALETAVVKQDHEQILALAEQMLHCFDDPLPQDQSLFLHLKQSVPTMEIIGQCRSALLQFFQSEALSFMADEPRFIALMKQYHCPMAYR